MKNVTITLEEEVAHWARIRAAEMETSVSRLVGRMLRQKMAEEQGYEAAMQQYLSLRAKPLKASGDAYPRREEVHDRDRLR